jgi:hypothetical protein
MNDCSTKPWNRIIKFGIFPRGDHRDWNAIRAWAENLKPILKAE